jgi:hypothetical protein
MEEFEYKDVDRLSVGELLAYRKAMLEYGKELKEDMTYAVQEYNVVLRELVNRYKKSAEELRRLQLDKDSELHELYMDIEELTNVRQREANWIAALN